jgi:uncharacterized membrane protein YdbT with pleckstrin-like domain
MVKFGSTDNKPKVVLLLSLATSIVLDILFLSGALLTNVSRGETAYTHVDMAAGSIFVFVISMIISLSLWPRITEWIENRETNNKIPD